MTWKQIKDAALQMMFSFSQGGNETQSAANDDYLLAMAAPANLAMRDLAGVCPIRRTLTVKQYQQENTVTSYTESDDGILIESNDAKAFYCQIDGVATVHFEFVQEDDTIVRLDSVAVNNAFFAPVRYVYAQGTRVRVLIEGNVRVKDYAFYDWEYQRESEIPSPAEDRMYSVVELIESQNALPFLGFDEKPARLDEMDVSGYVKFDGIDTLCIPCVIEGEIKLHYLAYPTPITADTDDGHEIELCGEAADLIPLYIASVVYLEDDRNLAQFYRGEYYNRRNAVAKSAEILAADEFVTSSGW